MNDLERKIGPVRAIRWIAGIALSVLAFSPATLRAEPVFLGPTPYLSAADSPFDLSGLGTTFFLEDFEDGELNTPGIYQPLLPITHAAVIPPSPFTDSVDADDGAIDGFGTGGHSLASSSFMIVFTDPPRISSFIYFAFDPDALGFLPNAFGFVWTDAVQNSRLRIEILDENFRSLGMHEFGAFGEGQRTGQTDEDRFVGIVSDAEFAWVTITSLHVGEPDRLEIDHVQYGLIVPEPSTFGLLMMMFATAAAIIDPLRVSGNSSKCDAQLYGE